MLPKLYKFRSLHDRNIRKRQLLGVLMRRTKAVRLWLDSKVEALLCLPTSLRMVAY